MCGSGYLQRSVLTPTCNIMEAASLRLARMSSGVRALLWKQLMGSSAALGGEALCKHSKVDGSPNG